MLALRSTAELVSLNIKRVSAIGAVSGLLPIHETRLACPSKSATLSPGFQEDDAVGPLNYSAWSAFPSKEGLRACCAEGASPDFPGISKLLKRFKATPMLLGLTLFCLEIKEWLKERSADS